MAFPLRHPAVAGVVAGMRSAEEVRRNLAAFARQVPEGLWSDLAAAGLLDERASQPAPPEPSPLSRHRRSSLTSFRRRVR
ncbi:hypothetical protein [Nonomuraea rubra]|uniref:hypothetical protein n=1 Tax=Nonomuraea rubra TaxID=46180 RepID=UPI0033F88A52